MRPVLIHLGWGQVIHAYPAMLALAFLVGTLWASRESQRQDPPFYLPPRAGVWGFLGALFGAKVFWIIQYASVTDLWRAFLLWEPGLVYYGGLIGGAVAVLAYFRLVDVPLVRGLDVAAPFLALGQGITRIGCFLNGCCWGEPCHAPWAVTFPVGSLAYGQQVEDDLIAQGAAAPLPVHPTQIYMVVGLVLTFLVLKWMLPRTRAGVTLLSYLVLYGLLRFVVEFYRGDSARSVVGLTVSQTISLILLVVGVAGLLWLRPWRKPIPPETGPEVAPSEVDENTPA